MPTEPETEMWGDEWIEAYQSVLNGYQDCMAAGPGGNSPYLYYVCVRLALEAGDGSSRLVYGLYDVNSDGTPELVLSKEDLWFGRTITTDFEVYAFDGTGAVPLCREPLEEYEIPVIGDNGTIWSTAREGDAAQASFYILPYHGSELVQTMHFDTMYSDTEYALFEKCRLKDAVITYYSILEPVQSSFDSPPAAVYSAEWLAHVKDQLGIPADLVTYDVIDWKN